MSTALSSGVAGLQNFQKAMDVLGNNIANVNTTAFKSARVNFVDSLSQTMSGAFRPDSGEGTGGSNPVQLGLGASIGAVTGVFSQGNLQSTGIVTDLAIEGSSFFVVSDGSDQFYTRDGSFSLDATGQMVMSGSGLVLQGYAADEDGNISGTSPLEDVNIPMNTAAPAEATTKIEFARNLNADSEALGTVLVSKSFLEYTAGSDRLASPYVAGPEPLDSLMDSQGQSLHLVPGTKMTFSASSSGIEYKSVYAIQEGDSYRTLRNRFQTFLQAIDPSMSVQFQAYPNQTTMGAMTVVMGTKDINNLQIQSDNPAGASHVSKALRFPNVMSAATSRFYSTDTLRAGAVGGQILRDSYTADGTRLSNLLAAGDRITVHASVGGKTVGGTETLIYDPTTTTWNDMLALIQDNLRLPGTDSSGASQATVSMDPQGSYDNIPDGAIIVRGLPGTGFTLSDLRVEVTDSAGLPKAASLFGANFEFTTLQEARDAEVASTSITTYDVLGAPHNVAITFTKSQVADLWHWDAAVEGTDRIQSGGGGTLTFGPDGTVSNFTYTDGSDKLFLLPGNESSLMEIQLVPGGAGQFAGLTQFCAPTTATATSQDGHAMGSLQCISIGADGIVNGQFSNGTTRSLSQVAMADFSNPTGLVRNSNSVYAQSANSGDPEIGKGGSVSPSTIRSGTLEMSNVDLAEQFTDMITYQRGYQANAKVITTSDGMMQELLGIVLR